MLLGLADRLFYCSSYLYATVSLLIPRHNCAQISVRFQRAFETVALLMLKALVAAHCDSKESFEGRHE